MFQIKQYSLFQFSSEPTPDGYPIPELPPVQKHQVHYFEVTEDGLKPGVNPDKERIELWTEIDEFFHKVNADIGRIVDEL